MPSSQAAEATTEPAAPAEEAPAGDTSAAEADGSGGAAAKSTSAPARKEAGKRTPASWWTAEEDAVLGALVRELGPSKWSVIAAKLPGRIGKQCRERWTNHLSDEVPRQPRTALTPRARSRSRARRARTGEKRRMVGGGGCAHLGGRRRARHEVVGDCEAAAGADGQRHQKPLELGAAARGEHGALEG